MPSLRGIEDKYGPTQVHLQVYDHTCHVLPMISMSEPAKHCYRAIANFCRFATRNHPSSQSSWSSSQRQRSNPAESAGFGMTELSESQPPNSLSTQFTQSVSIIPPPSLAPLTLADPIPINASPVAMTVNDSILDRAPRSKPSFRKTFSFLSNSRRSKGTESDGQANATPISGSRTPSEFDLQSRDETDGEAGYYDSPVQENLPDAGPSGQALDPNFPADEIKMPANIPEGFAGNSSIYQVRA
jgi:hypothetical protein